MSRLASIGLFAESKTNNSGLAKIVALDRVNATVSYFDSVGTSGQSTVIVPRESLVFRELESGTRAYWQVGNKWRAGIVTGHFSDGYRLRRLGKDEVVPDERVFVRWNRPIADPTELLQAKVFERPDWFARRTRFIRSAVKQRAAAQGISALLSSVVDLHLHQLDVVRRVLEDPIQRYLLADEVGLGKTIEAGFIIREHLHEDPNARVLILLPQTLKAQWAHELEQKFLLPDIAPRVRWWFVEHEALGAKAHWLKSNTWSMLVVDEAHRVATPELFASPAYQVLEELAAAIPRLLLLSGTPLLNNEASFLGMLHLLDPAVHDLTRIEEFREKVRSRQEVARLFFTFDDHQPPFLLAEKLDILDRLFPADVHLSAMTAAVRSLVDLSQLNLEESARVLVREIRVYISERYRLHRRLLRHRRSDIERRSGPSVRTSLGKRELVELQLPSEVTAQISTWLERVRDQLLSSSLDAHVASSALLAIAENSHDPSEFSLLLQAIESNNGAQWHRNAIGNQYPDLMKWKPSLETSELLRGGREVIGDLWKQLVDVLVESLRALTNDRKAVVFVTGRESADRLADELKRYLGEDSVVLFLGDSDVEDLNSFQETRRVRVLVGDRSAEEGLNLQNASVVAHFDLPFAPMRIDQRIGRLDRLGRGRPLVQSWVFSYPTTTLHGAWKACLNEMGVFNHSIARFQYAIDEVMPSIRAGATVDGPSGILQQLDAIRASLATEGQAIEEQDTLDSLEVEPASKQLLDRLEALEAKQTVSALEPWVADRGGILQFTRKAHPRSPELLRYEFGQRSQLPEIPIDELVKKFRRLTERWGTYSRAVARRHDETRLFRLGEPFFDAILDFTAGDDRGACTAVWREIPEYQDPDWLAIGFFFVVEANLTPASEVIRQLNMARVRRLSLTNLRHRADRLFPPASFNVWLDISLKYVSQDRRELLKDIGLDPRDKLISPENGLALRRFMPAADWEDFVRRARVESEALLRRSKQFASALNAGAEAARAAMEFESFQRKSRQVRNPQFDSDDSDETAALIWSAILSGVASPKLMPDSVALAVMSRESLPGPASS